jgi:hypothetical protein
VGLDIRIERLLERIGVDRKSNSLSRCFSSELLEIRLIPGYGHSPLLPVAIRGTHHVEQELGLIRSRLQGLVDLASGKGDRQARIRFRRIHELGLGTDLVHPVSFPRRRATH